MLMNLYKAWLLTDSVIGKAMLLIHQVEIMENKKIVRKELLHIVTKLHRLFTISPKSLLDSEDLKLAITIAGSIDRWVTCEGRPGLKKAKAWSNFFVRTVMGASILPIPLSNRFNRLSQKAVLSSEKSDLSKIFWVSVFSCFRLYRLKPEIDTTTITSSFKGRPFRLLRFGYLSKLKAVNQSFRRAIPPIQNWSATWEWHISGSSGPNGSISYTRYLDDLRALSYSRLGIGVVILYFALPYDNKWETAKALWNTSIAARHIGDSNPIHSRLAFLSDKGGKTRVVALGDILSQSLLKVVHHRCNSVLRNIHQDGTFDQDSSRRVIKKMSEDSVFLASIDLSAATDRFWVLFQVFVIIYLRILTPLQAFGWWWVTTKRSFYIREEQKYVRYKVGQPMGLLSSWPVMAISHHFLVRWSFAVSGSSDLENAPYQLLGDDLTLAGDRVAGSYLDFISYLGMDYSPDKTYLGVGLAEFAKSLFCHGKDLTPFPLALLRFNRQCIVSNVQAIMTECKRINLPLTASALEGLHPKRWRNLVLLAALSPQSPRYALDLVPRDNQWVFQQFVSLKRLKSVANIDYWINSSVAFRVNDPAGSSVWLTPYRQIGRLADERLFSLRFQGLSDAESMQVLMGSNWISYPPERWPTGLPSVGDSNLVQGPVWERERDDVIFRSSLLELNKLLPGYFTLRCVGPQVGE